MMLKIERVRGEPGTRICLSGELRRSNLAELRAEIDRAALPATLDLEEIGIVDIEGVRLLNQCQSQGVEVVNCTPYVREWMIQEKRASGCEK
jgi:hypothetical protein